MSQENREIAQQGYEAFARRDFDAALALMDPEIEAHNPPEVPEAGVHRGHDAVRRDWEQTLDLFDDFSIEVEKYFDAGDELVVFLCYRGRGRGSDAEVVAPMAHIWTIRDGHRADAVRAVWERWESDWEGLEETTEELIDAGDNVVHGVR
jgi:ketosteroid isomerase-like protein